LVSRNRWIDVVMIITYPSLKIHSPALVQPEMLPGAIGHQVTTPAVGELVRDDIDVFTVLSIN
jgi:hypothetical protein